MGRCLVVILLALFSSFASAQTIHWIPADGQFAPRGLLLAQSDGTLFGTSDSGLVRSFDHGASWQIVRSPVGNDLRKSWEYAGGIITVFDDSVMVSRDHGASWAVLARIPHSTTRYVAVFGAKIYISQMAARSISTDNGVTWDTLSVPSNTIVNAWYMESNGTLWGRALGRGYLTSSDWGVTWSQAGWTRVLYGRTDNGEYISGDTTQRLIESNDLLNWKPLAGSLDTITSVQISDGLFIQSNRYHQKISLDAGRTWRDLPRDEITMVLRHGDTLWASGYALHYSFDAGRSWIDGPYRVKDQAMYVGPNGRLFSLALSGQHGYGIDVTSDHGYTWHKRFPLDVHTEVDAAVGTALGLDLIANDSLYVLDSLVTVVDTKAMPVSRTGLLFRITDSLLFAGTDTLWKTSDGGESWAVSFIGRPRSIVSSAHAHLLLATLDTVWISSDEGETWNPQFTSGFNEHMDLQVFPHRNAILGSASGWSWVSTDEGIDWQSVLGGQAIDSLGILIAYSDSLLISSDLGATWRFPKADTISGSFFVGSDNTLFVHGGVNEPHSLYRASSSLPSLVVASRSTDAPSPLSLWGRDIHIDPSLIGARSLTVYTVTGSELYRCSFTSSTLRLPDDLSGPVFLTLATDAGIYRLCVFLPLAR